MYKHIQLTCISHLSCSMQYVVCVLIDRQYFLNHCKWFLLHYIMCCFLLVSIPRFLHIHYQNTAALLWLLRLLCSM